MSLKKKSSSSGTISNYTRTSSSNHNSHKPIPFTKLKKRIRERFVNEHKTTTTLYNKKIVNDIIYNEKTQVVANFKEYLIFDDNSEFLKR
jgi:hypothetical protein